MKKITVLFSLVFMVALTSFVLLSPETENGYKVGDKARDFRLKNIDGKMLSLADYKDAKGFIVIFTCNHCPFSVAYEDRIIELNKKFAPKGYPVIAINPNDPVAYPDDSYDNMKVRAKEKGFSFPYLLDESQAIAATYGAKKTPHTFILQKENNKNIVKYIGAIDDSKDASKVKEKYVEKVIKAISKGKASPYTATKAVGCSIKWKKK